MKPGAKGGFALGLAIGAVLMLVGVLIVRSWDWDAISDQIQSAWSGVPAEKLRHDREQSQEALKRFDELSKTPTEAERKAAENLRRALRGED